MRMAVVFMMMVLASGCGRDQIDTDADLILVGGHILTQTEVSYPVPPTAVAIADGNPDRGVGRGGASGQGPGHRGR